MEVGAEAKRIMVVALGKLYTSRTQRGGLRLHRSLLLTLVMKSARDMYHAAAQTEEMEQEADTNTHPALEQQEEAFTDTHPTLEQQETDTNTHSALEQQEEALTHTRPTPEQQEGPLTHTHPDPPQPEPQGQEEAVTQPERAEQTFTHGSRKRRGQSAAVPDFLPLKKAKLDCPPAQLVVLMDYVTCGDLGTGPSPLPVPVPVAIAAC